MQSYAAKPCAEKEAPSTSGLLVHVHLPSLAGLSSREQHDVGKPAELDHEVAAGRSREVLGDLERLLQRS